MLFIFRSWHSPWTVQTRITLQLQYLLRLLRQIIILLITNHHHFIQTSNPTQLIYPFILHILMIFTTFYITISNTQLMFLKNSLFELSLYVLIYTIIITLLFSSKHSYSLFLKFPNTLFRRYLTNPPLESRVINPF